MKTKNFLFAAAVALSTVAAPAAAMLNAAPVFAADVTIDNSDLIKDHTFKAYQIFKGTYDSESNALTDITWGSGIDETAFLAALKSDNSFKIGENNAFSNCNDAADVANTLSELQENSGVNKTDLNNAFARLAKANKTGDGSALTVGSSCSLDNGYYLIVDETVFTPDESGNIYNNAYNNVLLEVVGDSKVNIDLKTDVPTLVKKVQEDDKTNLSYGTLGDKYNDVADYSIGETVPFGFESTVPDMTHYTTYTYKIHDKMSKGLTLKTKADSTQYDVEVKIGEASLTYGTDYTVEAKPEDSDTGNTLITIDVKDFKKYTKGSKIVVKYNAVLNTNAVIGLDGNPNEVYLEYSNKPGEEGTGKTEPDKVIVFTYELDATKVDKNDHKKVLSGAKFKLLKEKSESSEAAKIENGKFAGWVSLNEGTELESDEEGKFSITGLDSGTYYLKETVAPTGYTVPSQLFEVRLVATTANGQNYNGTAGTALTAITVNEQKDSGTVATGVGNLTVENTSSSSLPETGGTGTTMLYTVGAVLVGGTAVFYVTNKRMKKEED